MATYTFTKKTPPTEPGQENWFSNLAVDAAHVALTGVTGAGPQTADGTATPLTSPLTVSNTAVTTLIVPDNAAQVTLIAATNTINISEADSSVASKYFTIPVNTPVTLDVARTHELYLEANTGAATVSFWFNVI